MIFKNLKKFPFKFKKLFLLFLLLIISGALFLVGGRKDIENTKEAQACWDQPVPAASSGGGCAGVGGGGGGACGNGCY